MNRTLIVGIALTVATACNGGSPNHSSNARSPARPPSTANTGPTSTSTTLPTASPPPTPRAPDTAHPTTSAPDTYAITIAPSAYGDILETGPGFTLYTESAATNGQPSAACTGACGNTWPPLIAKTTPRIGPGVNQALVGTVTRPDGTRQLTYAGRTLHTYAQDQQPGHIDGQAIDSFGGTWLVVPATGRTETAPPGSTPVTTPAGA